MSSSFVRECSDASTTASGVGQQTSNSQPSGNKTVFIIVNNDAQIDQEQLSSILANHAGASSEVSVVQVDGSQSANSRPGYSDPTSNLQAAAAVGLLNNNAADDTIDGIAIDDSSAPSSKVSGCEPGSGYSDIPFDMDQLENILAADAQQLLSDEMLDVLNMSSGDGDERGTASGRNSAATRPSQQEGKKIERAKDENRPVVGREGISTPASKNINKLNIEVQVEFDHQKPESKEENVVSSNEEEDIEDSDEDDSEDSNEDTDSSGDAPHPRGRGRGRPRGSKRGSLTAGRARGSRGLRRDSSPVLPRRRGRPPKSSNEAVLGRGRPPRGSRGRGRGFSKGKQIPVMPESEEDEAASPAADNDIEALDKILSDLHGDDSGTCHAFTAHSDVTPEKLVSKQVKKQTVNKKKNDDKLLELPALKTGITEENKGDEASDRHDDTEDSDDQPESDDDEHDLSDDEKSDDEYKPENEPSLNLSQEKSQFKKKRGRKKKIVSEDISQRSKREHKAKTVAHHKLPKKDIIVKKIDKKGFVRYVKRRVVDTDFNGKERQKLAKKAADPQDYLKILQLAQKNVETGHSKEAVSSNKSERHEALKKTQETFSKEDRNVSRSDSKDESSLDHKKELRRLDSTESKQSSSSATKTMVSPKKAMNFSAALDVSYKPVKKQKVAKKFVTLADMRKASEARGKEARKNRLKNTDDTHSYKEANKKLLSKLETKRKLSRVSEEGVALKLVQGKKASKTSLPSKKDVNNTAQVQYREEYSEEDEEMDELDEQIDSEAGDDQVRRSRRAPKKKFFGDEMIVFDEKETISDENGGSEEEATEDERESHGPSSEQKEEDWDSRDDVGGSSEDVRDEEEDPNKPWCICRQPHNDRFMICCDRCEDWFHGSCVGVSKTMGKEMVDSGREWLCPRCRKLIAPGRQLSKEEKPKKSSNAQMKKNPRVLVMNNKTQTVLSGKEAPLLSELSQWLREHPDYSLVTPTALKSATTPVKPPEATVPSKPSKITIDVRKVATEASSRGPNTPVVTDNTSGPTSNERKTILLTSVKVPLNKKNDVDHSKKTEQETPKPPKNHRKRSRTESESRSEWPTSAPSTPNTTHSSPVFSSVADVRKNVRKALEDSLLRRVNENEEEFSTTSREFVEKLVLKVEEELYNYCGKGVNIKYKSRYRSLVFNIRDTKNGGLFRQILTGAVTPQKLATMTSDEMASKELAEWRQTQGKKELEAIQKYELDMMTLGNTYIMKSHKGEIEIHKDAFIQEKEKALETINQLPEEQPLECTATAADDEKVRLITQESKEQGNKDKHKHRHKERERNRDRDRTKDRDKNKDNTGERVKGKNRERDKDRDRDKEGDRDRGRDRDKDKDRDKDRGRDKNRGRDVDGDDDKDRDRDRDKERNKVKDRDNDRERGKDSDRDKDKGREKDADRVREKRKEKDSERRRHSSSTSSTSSRHHHHNRREKREEKRDNEKQRSKQDEVTTSEDVNNDLKYEELSVVQDESEPTSTVGPLLNEPELPLPPNLPTHLPGQQEDMPQSPQLEEDPSYIPPYSPEAIPPQSPLPGEAPLDPSPSTTPPLTREKGAYSPSAPPYSKKSKLAEYQPTAYSKRRLSRSALSKFEVPSTAEQIAVWRGSVHMSDVAKFAALAYEVSGGSVNFTQDVPEEIEVVGRIAPDNVWTYIADTKKAATKEILVVRFQPTSEEEKVSYIALYSYLSSKKRYGVVGNCDSAVKDFYIVPLASHQPIPQVLLPLDGPGFEEQRPHMLVGVVIRTKPKRVYDSYSGTWNDIPELSEEGNAMLSELKEACERSFTPPMVSSATTPYDPEEEESMNTRDVSSASPTPSTPPGELSDDSLIELPVNKAVKRSAEETMADVKKAKPNDLSKEQETMLAELNRQLEQHKKELASMQKCISTNKVKSESEEISKSDSKGEASKSAKGSVKLDANISDLRAILENIKKKEEEIKEKEEEVQRRTNEALKASESDTDMRLILPQPGPSTSIRPAPSLLTIPPPVVSNALPTFVQTPPPPIPSYTPQQPPPTFYPSQAHYVAHHPLPPTPPLRVPVNVRLPMVASPVQPPHSDPYLPDHYSRYDESERRRPAPYPDPMRGGRGYSGRKPDYRGQDDEYHEHQYYRGGGYDREQFWPRRGRGWRGDRGWRGSRERW